MKEDERLQVIETFKKMQKKLWNANKTIKDVATRINTLENKLTENNNRKKKKNHI